MATITLDQEEYQLVVPAAKTWFTISSTRPDEIEGFQPIRLVRTAADATAPSETDLGHMIELGSGATRGLFPDGAIWAKTVGGAIGYLAVDYNA